MLVYANSLSLQGAGAAEAAFKAIGAWLKEQLGHGLHPDQLKKDGEFEGTRGEVRSYLRIRATTDEEPALYSWVLRFQDDAVHGRQWIAEAGLKIQLGAAEFSCIVKTDEHSTLVSDPVMASQPRVIQYLFNNILAAKDADFASSVTGVKVKTVGQGRDSYHDLLAEIERTDRDGPIVLVSPTDSGIYLLNATHLQQKLAGLAQVVQVCKGFNSYDMAGVLGQSWSAWGGAVNIFYMPPQKGTPRARYFKADAIAEWGSTQNDRISQVLAWVTNNTNIPRLRSHIRPDGVMQLSLRRRMQAAREKGEQMDAAQLRLALWEASKNLAEQAKSYDELVEENSQLGASLSDRDGTLEDVRDELAKKDFTVQTLKGQLGRASESRGASLSAEDFLELVRQTALPLSPLQCLDLIEKLFGDRCTVLASARSSAQAMSRFTYGTQLLELLKRLVTDYRDKMKEGGDNEARKVFGKSEFAAKESETVMASKAMKRQRTFEYEGEQVEMFRHLKIGVDDDATKTIRAHFHWDAGCEKIVIGYCGKHLAVSSR